MMSVAFLNCKAAACRRRGVRVRLIVEFTSVGSSGCQVELFLLFCPACDLDFFAVFEPKIV
jgi:Ni,Fe-hydrogenase III small subunit